MLYIKKIIKKIFPNYILNKYRLYCFRDFIKEINSLDIEYMNGNVKKKDFPYVKLKNGHKFYGPKSTIEETRLYELIKKNIKISIDPKCFGVIKEIIERFFFPRSLPGQMIFSKSKYYLMRDPLNDFNISHKIKKKIARIFLLRKGDTVLDIGAHHGFGTLRMADYVGSEGKIIAFEADTISLSILNLNLSTLNNVIIVPIAVSNYKKKNDIFYYDNLPAGNSLQKEVLKDLGINTLVKKRVNIDTVDNVMKILGIKSVNHINITINGGEPEALDGASETIKSSEKIKITMPGWYVRDGKKLYKVLFNKLRDLGFRQIMIGKLGRVIAWK